VKKSVYYWRSILLLTFTIPLSQFISVRLLALIFIFSFFIKADSNDFTRLLRRSWDVIFYLSVLLIGLIYSFDLNVGFKVIETSFSFLALPIVLNKVSHFDKRKLHHVFLSFISGLILACSICLVFSLYSFSLKGDTSVFFYENFTQVISYQPTYMAYYISFSITVGLYFLYYEKLKIGTPLLIGILVFLFAVSMLTAGRTAYISMLFVFSFFILKFLFEEERTLSKKLTFAFAVFFLVSMLVINHFNFNTTSTSPDGGGDYWERLSLWKSAIDANPNIIFGVGTGDYKKVMNDYYNSHGLTQFSGDNSLNAHNQFLQLLFSNGLIGVFSILILIIRPLYLSVRYQNILGILVFFSFLIYSMTEVFLGRYQGVVFFALLHQIFIHFYYSRQPSFSLKEI